MSEENIESKDVKQPEIADNRKPNLISVSKDTQGLNLTDHSQLTAFIKQMIEAKALPKHLKTVPEVLSAWNYAAQLNLPPQVSLRNIAVIEGTPSLFGDLPLALVQRHPDFVFYEEFTIDKDYNRICFENKNLNADIFGGVVKLQRKGMAQPQTFSFTMEDAKRAGLLGRNNPWKTYPQIMVVRRARIIAIRALFADAISGAAIAEDFGNAPDLQPMRDVGGSSETEKFNQRYGDVVPEGEASQGSSDNGSREATPVPDMQTTE